MNTAQEKSEIRTRETVVWSQNARTKSEIKALLDEVLKMTNERVQVRLLERYGDACRAQDREEMCEYFNAWRVVAEANGDSQVKPIIAALAMMTFGAAP